MLYVVGTYFSGAMEIPDCESPAAASQHCPQTDSFSSAELCSKSGRTLSIGDPASETFHRTDLDDLPCRIGCIQLDHPYDGRASSASPSKPPADCDHEAVELNNIGNVISCSDVDPLCRHTPADVNSSWVGLLDHAYESSSWDSESTDDHSHWDHAYNVRCTGDKSMSVRGRCISGLHIDHSYDTQMLSELSCSETVLSLCLDHAYIASDLASSLGRRFISSPRWSSSDDLRSVSRAMPTFV